MKKENREEYIRLIIILLEKAKDETVIRIYNKLAKESV